MLSLVNGYITNYKYFQFIELTQSNDKEYRDIIFNEDILKFVKMLDEFRYWYNRPMSPGSWYRSEYYNDVVLVNNGLKPSKKSMHKLGRAFDCLLPKEFYSFTKERKEAYLENCRMKWIEICHRSGAAGGFGKYDTFFHIDNRDYSDRLNCKD